MGNSGKSWNEAICAERLGLWIGLGIKRKWKKHFSWSETTSFVN
jgi:hypothetical protein